MRRGHSQCDVRGDVETHDRVVGVPSGPWGSQWSTQCDLIVVVGCVRRGAVPGRV